MINIELNNNEKWLEPLLKEFNRLYQNNYPEILSWSHYDLYVKSNNTSPEDWKQFRLNPKIKQWYDEESELQLRTTVFKLLNEIDNGKSTGQAQTLTALLAQTNKLDKQESTTKIIYNFIPLTTLEMENPNVNIIQNIPAEIRDAIQIIGPRTDKT